MRLHGDGGTEGGGSVGRCPGSPLYLYVIDGRCEIGHVGPENGVRLGVVNRYAVDRDVDAVGVCAADTEARIADTCPGVRSHDDGRGLGDEIGDTLAIVFAAEFVFGYFAVSHRSTFGYFGGGDDYFVQR